MNRPVFLLLNLALAFYGVGVVWAHEVDIFRSWKLLDPATFHTVHLTHWRKLPYWVFAPVVLTLLGSIGLLVYYPSGTPAWIRWAGLICQFASHGLTARLWGRWQGMLSKDTRGPESPYLAKILSTHWIRTALITAYALILLGWSILVFSPR